MKKIDLGKSGLAASAIAMGCMRIDKMEKKEIQALVNKAMELGINLFEHADIYGGDGTCESRFGQAISLKGDFREKVLIQTKCGIRKGFFDFSKEHILASVDKSLSRLGTDYLDLLVLHRPDTLMEPEEIAEAFAILKQAGKVRKFGVSNQNPMQMQLLSRYLEEKLVVNQLQFSLTNTEMLNSGFQVNMQTEGAVNRDGGVFDYCRLQDVTIQAWSPFQYGFFDGIFIDNPKFPELNVEMEILAKKYGVTKSAIAVAWILRHPAKIQTVVGTTKISRLEEIAKAAAMELTREEWYSLYRAAGNILP